jgi:hypothetical protein
MIIWARQPINSAQLLHPCLRSPYVDGESLVFRAKCISVSGQCFRLMLLLLQEHATTAEPEPEGADVVVSILVSSRAPAVSFSFWSNELK